MVRQVRLGLIAVSTTFLVTACPWGPPTDCAPGGIYLDVPASLLARVDTVHARVCWQGRCSASDHEVSPEARASCSDVDCAELFEILLRLDRRLPERDVKVRVRLLADSGTARVDQTITAMPSSGECGGEPSVGLDVSADGTVTEP